MTFLYFCLYLCYIQIFAEHLFRNMKTYYLNVTLALIQLTGLRRLDLAMIEYIRKYPFFILVQ